MRKKTVLALGVLAIGLICSGAKAQQGSSDDWRGPVDGVEVQMPTAVTPIPLPGPGQEAPLMYGPGGAEALLNAIRRAQMPEGQQRLLQFQPQQNTIDGVPPAAPPLGANFSGPGFGGIWTPGDPVVAAGSTYVGVMINSQCDFYTKAGVWSGGSVLKVFFAPVYDSLNCRDPFDVKIIFDHHVNRWVMLALTYCSAAQKSYYLVAVSQTINPLGLWWLWALDVMDPLEANPLWADYPGLGFDADSGVYITSNQYAFGGGFNYAKIRALRKGALYAGTAIWWDYWGMVDADGITTTFTIKPAHTFGNPGAEYLVNTKWAGGNTVDLWSLLPGDPFPANLGAVGIGWYFPPPTPPCSDSGLSLFDCRTQDAQYRNNHLYTSFHEEWDWGMGVKAVVRFLKIDIPLMAAAIDERYGHPDYHYFFPTIYSAPNDNIITVFNRCGYGEIQEFISARYSARFLTQGDVASRASLYLQAGQAWYGDWVNPNRWGDYSGIAYDPFQFCTMWIYSMYATNAPKPANWSTWIGSVFTHPQIEKNHFKTWRIEPQTFSTTVFVEDQFMSDELVLDQIEFFSNPVKKDTFEIVDSLEHLTWYRAHGRDTLLEVEYSNQFGIDTVHIDSVEYLLLPTAKEDYPFPESLDHYKAYRIKDPVAFDRVLELEDQFDLLYGEPEFIDSLKPIYFLTPALKNMPQPMFDSVTHYVAYEIFPQHLFPLPVNTSDQFGPHVLQVVTSKILLVPTLKLRAEPPPPPNHYKTWLFEYQPFDQTVFVQDQFMEDDLYLTSLEFISNPVKKVVDGDTFDIMRPDDHLTWYGASGRDTLIQVEYVNQFESTSVAIDMVEWLLVPTQKEPHAPPENLDHYKAYNIQNPVEFPVQLSLEDQFDVLYGSPEYIEYLWPRYFLTPCIKNMEQPQLFDSVTHYVAYEMLPTRYFPLSVDTWDQFGSHVLDVMESMWLLVPTTKLEVCQPPTIGCPADEIQNSNGVYTTTTQWSADDGNPADPSVELISVAVQPPLPPGISAANVNFAGPVPGPGLGVKSTWGTVTYTVADHCQPGGSIALIATNSCPPPNNTATCTFNVTLTNDPPDITQPDFLEGFVDDTVQYEITGTDPNGDIINDAASINIIPGCGTYSITRTAGHGTSSGTWQITWYTDTCAVCDTHIVIHDLTDTCGATSYCTTWVHLSERRECDPNDPYDCDTLWVECGNMRVPPGGGLVTVDMAIANDESLKAIQVILSYAGSPTCCDSMPDSENTVDKVFAGSIIENWELKVVQINHQAKTVSLGATPIAQPCLPPGKGHFGTLTLFGDSCCTIQMDTTSGPGGGTLFTECYNLTNFYPVCRIDTCHIDRNNPPIIDQPDFLEGYVDDEVQYTIDGTDPDGDAIEDDASIDIQPGCGSGYSITRISGHGTSTGTWEITWNTDGCTPCDTHMVIHDLTDVLGATAYCTTLVHLSQPESLYWKPPYEDYAPSGMVDIDQKQDGWLKQETEQWSFCGPCAVANCFKWFDSKYNVPPGGPGDGFDQFPLVRDYLDNNTPLVGFDDHDPWNVDHTATPWGPAIGPPPPTPQPFVPGPQTPGQVPPWGELVERLAWYFNTDGIQTGYCEFTGTRVQDMQAGIDAWLRSETFTDGSSLFDTLCEVTTPRPSFAYVESLVEKCEDVILLLGFWYYGEGPGEQEFIRGDIDENGVIDGDDYMACELGPPFSCDDASDVDDNGVHSFEDCIYLLDYIYGGPEPPPPFPHCGPDPTPDALDCADFPPCPMGGGQWYRIGGHYVTVAGVNSEAYRIAFSDPFIDAAEFGAPGRIGNGTLIPHSFPHDGTVHNDEGNVSHDIYTADTSSISPGGQWWLPGYAIIGDPGWWSWNFYAQNVPDEFIGMTAPWDGVSEIFTEVEYCVHISPWDYRGDCNVPGGDGFIDAADIVFLINHVFLGTSAPTPYSSGDCNCDGIIDVADIILLINHVFTGTSAPRCCDP